MRPVSLMQVDGCSIHKRVMGETNEVIWAVIKNNCGA